MGPWSRVRVAKCQMLVTSFFVLLLGLLLAAVAALTHFGAHFAVLRRVSTEGSPYEALDHWAFFTGISLAGLLGLGAVLSATAAVREAGRLMAGGFLCFALVFCALAQVAFWRLRNPTQVEDAALDAYDLAYDRAVRSPPGAWRQDLLAIQDTFLCCGKSSPPGLLGDVEAGPCPGAEGASQDCLQGIRGFLRTHGHVVSILASVGLASMSPRPAAPGAQLLQTLRGGARPASARRPGPWRTPGEPPAAPGPLMLCVDPPPHHLSAHGGTDAPASGPCPSRQRAGSSTSCWGGDGDPGQRSGPLSTDGAGVPHRLPAPGTGWELGSAGRCRLHGPARAPLACPPLHCHLRGSDGVGSPVQRTSPTSLLHGLERALDPRGLDLVAQHEGTVTACPGQSVPLVVTGPYQPGDGGPGRRGPRVGGAHLL